MRVSLFIWRLLMAGAILGVSSCASDVGSDRPSASDPAYEPQRRAETELPASMIPGTVTGDPYEQQKADIR